MRRIAFFILYFFVLYSSMRFLLSHIDDPANNLKYIVPEYVKKKPTILNIGSSHARTFLPLDGLGSFLTVHNSAQDLIEIDFILRKLLTLHKPQKILIAISDYSLFLDNAQIKSHTNRNQVRIKTRYSVGVYALDDIKNSIIAFNSPITRPDHLSKMISINYSNKNNFDKTITKNSLLNHEDIIKSRQIDFNQMDKQKTNIELKKIKLLVELVKWIHLHNIEVILYTPPFHYTFVNQQISEKINQTNQLITSHLPNLKYLDHSFIDSISNKTEYFSNADHLNELGKKKYISIIREKHPYILSLK